MSTLTNPPQYSSRMSIGDYVPHVVIENNTRSFDLQGKAGQPNILFILRTDRKSLVERVLAHNSPYRLFVFTSKPIDIDHERYFYCEDFCRLFHHPLIPVSAFVLDNNLKVTDFVDGQTLEEVLDELARLQVSPADCPPPVLIINDAIDPLLAEELIDYINNHESSGALIDKDFKRRLHIHPSKDLELRLDDKLSKSVLPEIAKVYFSEITHRETYKVCRYSGANSGKFGKHRDTISPHLHRRYAMTLVLNDDYAGGGIAFPEYTNHIVHAPKYSAVIFPGSLFHQVKEIGSGDRYVVISFFFGEAEARTRQELERYRFKVQRDIRGMSLRKLSPTE